MVPIVFNKIQLSNIYIQTTNNEWTNKLINTWGCDSLKEYLLYSPWYSSEGGSFFYIYITNSCSHWTSWIIDPTIRQNAAHWAHIFLLATSMSVFGSKDQDLFGQITG